MSFSIRGVNLDKSCTSQMLLDGMYVSKDRLLTQRDEALFEFYPCQSECCVGAYSAVSKQRPRPQLLRIRMSQLGTFKITLTRNDQNVQDVSELLPVSTIPGSKPQSFVSCEVHFEKTTRNLKVTIFVDGKRFKSLLFAGDPLFDSHDTGEAHVTEPFSFVDMLPRNHSLKFSCKTSSHEKRWIYSALLGPKAQEEDKALTFDDTLPLRTGLTGAYAWNGLQKIQAVAIREITFWVSRSHIVGFQAVYLVNGIRKLGPRHRLDYEALESRKEKFVFHSGENIQRLMVYNASHSSIACLAFTTDCSRFFRTGCDAARINGKPEVLNRAPDTRVIAFRGSLGKGLDSFGVIAERVEPDTEENTSPVPRDFDSCIICGASQTYFPSCKLFNAHVQECLEEHPTSRTPYPVMRSRVLAKTIRRRKK